MYTISHFTIQGAKVQKFFDICKKNQRFLVESLRLMFKDSRMCGAAERYSPFSSAQGQKAFAPSGRVAVMSEYRQVLLLNFHVNSDFGIQHRESGKRINYKNKETGQKDRAEHTDKP